MFDLRYHVASLAAVFIALIVGILIGVGLSGRGFVSDSERQLLNARIDELQKRAEAAESRAGALSDRQKGTASFIERAYPTLVAGKLRTKRIAVVFVGSVDQGVRGDLLATLGDAGAPGIARLRALRIPIDTQRLVTTIARRPVLAPYQGVEALTDLGRDFGTQLLLGGTSPIVEALTPLLFEERTGNDRKPMDAVVVVRTAGPQRGATALFLTGLYQGLGRAGIPAVGVERTDTPSTAVGAFERAGLSTVDDIDDRTGRAALVALLGGAARGQYGVKATAVDGVIPEPVAAAAPRG